MNDQSLLHLSNPNTIGDKYAAGSRKDTNQPCARTRLVDRPAATRSWRRVLPSLLVLIAGQAWAADTNPTIVLTPSNPTFEGRATIVAPGSGEQAYNVFPIDPTAFADGGILVIDIEISADSKTNGSFDLFPESVAIPTRGRPNHSVAGRYDIRRGSKTQLKHRFRPGARFNFAATGNWFSPKGNEGSIRFTVTVE